MLHGVNWRSGLLKNELKKGISNIFKRPHKHKWQIRGRNRYGKGTYRICLKCRETEQLTSKPFEKDLFKKCEPIAELDNQFDSNDNFIF